MPAKSTQLSPDHFQDHLKITGPDHTGFQDRRKLSRIKRCCFPLHSLPLPADRIIAAENILKSIEPGPMLQLAVFDQCYGPPFFFGILQFPHVLGRILEDKNMFGRIISLLPAVTHHPLQLRRDGPQELVVRQSHTRLDGIPANDKVHRVGALVHLIEQFLVLGVGRPEALIHGIKFARKLLVAAGILMQIIQ